MATRGWKTGGSTEAFETAELFSRTPDALPPDAEPDRVVATMLAATVRFSLSDQDVETAMNEKTPSNEALRNKDGVIDQRQQQIDPAGKYRVDPNEAAKTSQKQPGHDLHDQQKDAGDAK